MAEIRMSEDEILQRFDRLIESGSIIYDEVPETVPYTDGGFKFLFFISPILSRKPIAQTALPSADDPAAPKLRPGSDISIEGFEICRVGETHQLAANKFCFTRPLMLLLTQDGFKRQYEPLERADFAACLAVLRTMRRTDPVVFYNCGEPGGYSRVHRHVQVMPRPKDFTLFLDDEALDPATVPFLFFRRSLRADITPEELAAIYAELLAEMEAESPWRYDGVGTDVPHNVILTRRFVAVIPRQRAVYHEVSTNALGMLGLVAISSRDNMEDWIRRGPFDLLTVFGIPKKKPSAA